MKRKPQSKIPASVRAWTPAQAQAHRDGVRLRAATIPARRKLAPSTKEWARA